MEPRGLRNCNPGNIRITKDKWQGLRPQQTDKSFFQFTEMKWGYRALIITLQNYHRKHGCRTIADYINRWAPSCENNTGGYISSVCKDMEVPNSYVPNVDDKATMCAFAAAISQVENGVPAVMADIEAGWNLI
ncbi:MAG: structural protein P5 [Candidatus Phocaeicola faecipullorum]|nr:structural protein P5 [Candidatus Phocaeicola faecipullorum]